MDYKELMVGDWVMNACDTPRKVYELVQDQVTYELEGGGLNTTHCNQLYPIPLTEEILMKISDFKVRGEYVISGKARNPYIRIAWSRDKEKFYFSTLGSNCYLDYVHQLQHLLRLVGTDKEIEL